MFRQTVDSLIHVGQKIDPDKWSDDIMHAKTKKCLAHKEFYTQGMINLLTAFVHFFTALTENTEYIVYVLLMINESLTLRKESWWPRHPIIIEDQLVPDS